MAKQVGPIKFRGVIDDVCGRLTEDGIILQTKTGPTREQVLHNDNFINTRRNAREFGGAVDASTLLRRVLGYTVKAVKHAKLVSYMNQKLHAVVMSDVESAWGERCVDKSDLQLLKGFDYNAALRLDKALPVTLEHSLDVATGQVVLAVPGGLVRCKRVFPAAATHFRIVSCAGAVDFTNQRCSFDIVESELLPLGKVMGALELDHQLVGKPGEVLLHTAGMMFYEVVDGKAKMLRGGVLRVLEVERVEEVVAPVVVQGTRTPAHTAQPHTCASVCVAEAMPVLQVVSARNMACASCVLDDEMEKLLRIRLAEKEEAGVVVDELPGKVNEIVGVVGLEVEYFALGMVDAKGVVLGGDVMNCEKKTKQTAKKMRLRIYHI